MSLNPFGDYNQSLGKLVLKGANLINEETDIFKEPTQEALEKVGNEIDEDIKIFYRDRLDPCDIFTEEQIKRSAINLGLIDG